MCSFEKPDGTKDERMEDMSVKIDAMHRWFVGNGKVGMFEKIRNLFRRVRVVEIAIIILLVDAIASGRINRLMKTGLKILGIN